jgi:outer membrane murein-binding lipoprotein Lpp
MALVLSPLFLAGCSSQREKQIEKIHDDEETVKKASAAVNEVIRASTDCDAAKPLMAEAYKQIEEADKLVTAPATHQTLSALKAQVDRVAQVCP